VEPGKFSTHPQHIAPEKIGGVERGAEWLLIQAASIGEHVDQWAQSVIRGRGIGGLRTVMGLLSLADKYAHREIDKACQIASSYGAYRLKSVRSLLKTKATKQEQLEFVDDHPIIRQIGVYGDLVRTAFQKTPAQDFCNPLQNEQAQP
jgi:hypothetical protein